MEPRRAVGDSVARVRAGAWSAAQCGLAAAAAWLFAIEVLGHDRPFFAPVAAVVALGLHGSGRLRRTAEIAAGVALGVSVGDLWVLFFGQGAWQIGVVVFLALVLALAINGGGLIVTQSALQAVFVVVLPRTPNSGLHRWQDALVGGVVALLVAALLPADPWKEAGRLRAVYLTDLADVVRDTAASLRSGSSGAAAEALARARNLEPLLARWTESLAAGRETARLSPLRRGGGARGQAAEQLTTGLTRASRNLRVLVRRVMVSLETGQDLPASLPGLLDALASALEQAAAGEDGVAPLVVLASRLDPVALGATSLSAQVVVGQLRVAVVDLLEGLGLPADEVRGSLPTLGA